MAGTLAIANGGTNGSATATAGAVSYGTGTAYAFTAAGTSGQVLTSNGSSAPSWTSQGSLAVGTATNISGGSAGAIAYNSASSTTTFQTTGTGVLTALGNNINATGGFVTVDGTATLTSKTLTDPAIIGTILEDIYTITDGAAFEVDPANGSIQLITLGASRTPKATNFAAGEAVTMMIDDGSGYTITWTDATWGGSGVVWKTNGGVAPTLNTTGYTVIVLWKVSTQVYGARVGDA
jgi:hypothetical protein